MEEGTGGDRCSSSLSVLCEARGAINRVFRGFGKPTGKPTLAQTWPQRPFATPLAFSHLAYPVRAPACLCAEIDSAALGGGTRYAESRRRRKERPLFLIPGRDDGLERFRLRPSARSRGGRRAARSGARVVDEHLGPALVEFRSSFAEQRCLGGARFVFHRESRRYTSLRHTTGSPFTLELRTLNAI